jgi:hypothetical protein
VAVIGRQASAGPRIRAPLLFTHFGLAATGLVLWIIYVATDSEALVWIAFILLAIVALLGWAMFALWYQRRTSNPPGLTSTAREASRPSRASRFPSSRSTESSP